MHYLTQLHTFSTDNLLTQHDNYLLLEGDLNPSLYQDISEVDATTAKYWVYENTEFHQEKQHGPLLVKLDAEQKLLTHFINHWVQQHMGVIISTQASEDELMQHLKNLRYVSIPKGDPNQKILFRWYEPRQLHGVLYGFSKQETAIFMHIISSISWCEWAHDQGIWSQVIKPESDEAPAFTAPLKISQATLNSISRHDEKYYVRQITREIINEYPSILKTENEETLTRSILTQTRVAISQGIDRRNEIKALFLKSNHLEVEKI